MVGGGTFCDFGVLKFTETRVEAHVCPVLQNHLVRGKRCALWPGGCSVGGWRAGWSMLSTCSSALSSESLVWFLCARLKVGCWFSALYISSFNSANFYVMYFWDSILRCVKVYSYYIIFLIS